MNFAYHFELQPIAGMYVAVATGKGAEKFSGIVRLNESGAKIFELLQSGKSVDETVAEMLKIYSADEAVIRQDVDKIVSMLQEKGLANL